jgi:cell division protein FtsN
MAQEDYISRSRAKKNKKNPYKPRGRKAVAKSERSGTFKLFILASVIAIIAGFGYFLYTISHNSNNVDVTPITLSAPVKQTKQADVDPIPEPYEEEWSYVEGLKNKEVEVKAYDVEQKGPYKMQCASFRNKDDAESLKARIAFTGLSSQVQKVKGSSGFWYKVVLGPFERKRQAEKARHKLKNNNINGCQIWLWT